MRRLARRGPEQMRGQIPDVRIPLKLAPGPALVLLIDDDALAAERLRIERSVGRGPTPDIRDRPDDLHVATFDENRGFYAALEVRRREIRARGGETAVEDDECRVAQIRSFSDKSAKFLIFTE